MRWCAIHQSCRFPVTRLGCSYAARHTLIGARMYVFIRPTQTFLSCQVCGGLDFARREIKMTTTGMTFLDLDWLNRSADGAICTRCGHVYTFMADAHQWLLPDAVNPDDLPRDPLADTQPGPTS
jgi:hypothetical protein